MPFPRKQDFVVPERMVRQSVALALLVLALFLPCEAAQAKQLQPTVLSEDGQSCAAILDDDFTTTTSFGVHNSLVVTADEPISSLYIVWEYIPGEWTLMAGERGLVCGGDGFLHEYVQVPQGANTQSLSLVLGDDGGTIADIYAFSSGDLPDFVQQWQPSYDKADILVISTHSDDEILFLGGAIPTYTDRNDVRVQVAYFTYPMPSQHYRYHELLNGLWTMGVSHYPQIGDYQDVFSDSLEVATEQYGKDASMEYIVRTIRRFKPQVIVGQDVLNGEYGHGAHRLCAESIADALDVVGDKTQYADSAELYGTWEVPKTYFHIYPENTIELDLRVPLKSFADKTCLEVLREAFLKHVSQQYIMWTVEDGYDEAGNPIDASYPCSQFGLYRSLVGEDTPGTNDMLEHIVPYDIQDFLVVFSQELLVAFE